MENILIDALKINDLKLAGAKSTPQNTDSNNSFESILQGLLGTGTNITKSKHAGLFTHKGTTLDIGLKENLETLSKLINKISEQLETNEGELDIAALEELIGSSLSGDEISFFQLIVNKDFSLEELQTALLEGDNPELQTMGLTIDSVVEEPLQLKIKKLIAGFDKIVKEIDQVLENKLNGNLPSEESTQSQENINRLLAVFESVKGKKYGKKTTIWNRCNINDRGDTGLCLKWVCHRDGLYPRIILESTVTHYCSWWCDCCNTFTISRYSI